MTSVRLYSPEHCATWDAYVDAHARGTVFHLSRWGRAVERTFGHSNVSLAAERDGRLAGVLPLFVVPTLKGRALVSVPYAVYGGILADDLETERLLLDAARNHAASVRAKYVELRARDVVQYGLPETDLYVTFERQLPEKPEDCLQLVPRKSRAAVRNGRTKFGLRSEFTENWKDLYELYAVNVRRLGSPTFPLRFLDMLREEFAGAIDVQNTLFEDRVVASVLSFYYKQSVIPYYSGCDANYFFTQCSNVMYCDLMEAGVRRGYRCFDFGRSRRDTGPYFFKRNMGFEP